MLRIRLQRKGRKKRPIWHIVVADSRSPRDGRIIEQVGRYDNVTEKKEILLNEDRIFYWLDSGAQPSDTVRKILRREGLLYKRHLMNWGKSEEEIEEALAEWQEYRDSKREDATSRKADYKDVLAAEEKEYKKKVQEAAKKAAAEVEAEKAAGELEAEDEAPKTEAGEIEEALENADADNEAESAEDSVEETAEVEEAAAEDSQEEVEAEEPVAEAEENEEVAEEETTAEDDVQQEEADAKEAAEAVEENVAQATEEPDTDEVAEEEEETEAAAEEETEDTDAEEDEEEEAKAETSGEQVSTEMTAKDAIDHINDTDLADLEGFVPEDEDRVTVQRAWESKQEEG